MLAGGPATVLPPGEPAVVNVDWSSLRAVAADVAFGHSTVEHLSVKGRAGRSNRTSGIVAEPDRMGVLQAAELEDDSSRPRHASRLNRAERASAWVELSEMQHPRGEHANAVVDGKIYVFGGLDEHLDGPDFVERYDPARDRWKTVSTMPLPRHHFTAGASVYGKEIWIVGGKTGRDRDGGVRRVDVYDTVSNGWRRGPDLPAKHWGGPAVIVDHTLHVLTGAINIDDSAHHHFTLDLQNESAGWQRAAAVPLARVHAAGVALDGKVYLIGGERNHTHQGGDTTNVQVYDPAKDSWSRAAPLPQPRSHLEWATFTYQGAIYSVAGVDSSQQPRGQSEIYRYTPADDHWELIASLPFPGVSVGAKVIDDTLYVFGGGDGDWFDGSLSRTLSLHLAEDEALLPGDVTGDGQINLADVDVFCAAHAEGTDRAEFDLTGDAHVNFEDLRTLVVDILSSRFGDSDLDGQFTSRDIVLVFQTGEFEDGIERNSRWRDGDWNCDAEFTSSDLILAFQQGQLTNNPPGR